ncbi:hypothetical protein [Streptomyces sp. PSKA30]|uniref:hypothetical protein n=1 Tax=Streptomyces sp. PSKA30 TaxID=2874597 RepID=UPI001CD0B3CB|nr:hypothetical protein [Streptomyces sp. PSKA30]MBZ9638011.1 hypothetical protein [Streptomyces sp. PSKA30]
MSERLPCPALYDGYDAGHYTLPDDVVKARDTYRGIEAMPWPKPPRNAWETVQDVATATVDAIHNGTKLPDVQAIEQARQAERIYQDALDMMGACLDLAAQRARTTLGDNALPIITSHLRPAHDQTWQTYQDAHRTLQEYGEHEPRRLLSAPAKVRKASDTCDQMAERYTAIREAYTDLRIRCGLQCADDPTGKYTAVRNHHELHPTRWANARTPWHGLTTRHYLDWMTDHGGQLWLPTPDEQTEAVKAEAHIGQTFTPRAA